jgi:hypothetical protein
MLAMVVAIVASNCISDSEVIDPEPSIKQRVASAKIIPGAVVLEERTAIYIEIPTKNGYLVFDVRDAAESNEIAAEVYSLYRNEFNENNLRTLNMAILKELAPSDNSRTQNQHIVCGEWKPISDSDPNSAVFRWCCNLDTGFCRRETCSCGYCC